MAARLWIREASGRIREVVLDEERAESDDGIVVGRDAAADIGLDDPAVSRFHARLTHGPQGWRVHDLGSSNSTYVNGDPVADTALSPGDQIDLGDCELQFLDEVRRVDPGAHTQVLATLSAGMEGSELGRAATVLDCLHEVARIAATAGSAEEFIDRALGALVEGLGVDRGALLEIEGEALVCRAAHARGGQSLRGFVLSQSIYREVAQSREAVLSRDTSSDDRFQRQASVIGEEIRSIVAAPVPVGERVGGILYLDRLCSGAAGAECPELTREDLFGAAVAAELFGSALRTESRIEGLAGEREALVRTIIDTHPIIGNSPAVRRLRDLIQRAAPTESTVLIQGETGTGKELVARALHYGSPRASRPFVAINCAAIPETLVESELFGHEKGAFTGATSRKPGRFEVAHGGTVFLDEIGDLPLSCQSKLLRLLEERCFERVGGTESVEADVRIVAATHRDLAQLVETREFREDLFYRLNVLQVTVAPLRERPGDVELLIEHFLDLFADRVGGPRRRLSPSARRFLVEHSWPGNIRQLRNSLESAVVLSAQEVIDLDDLPVVAGAKHSPDCAEWTPRSLQEVEREHIERVLDSQNWNKSRAAEILGIERSTLYARIRNHGLVPPKERS